MAIDDSIRSAATIVSAVAGVTEHHLFRAQCRWHGARPRRRRSAGIITGLNGGGGGARHERGRPLLLRPGSPTLLRHGLGRTVGGRGADLKRPWERVGTLRLSIGTHLRAHECNDRPCVAPTDIPGSDASRRQCFVMCPRTCYTLILSKTVVGHFPERRKLFGQPKGSAISARAPR